MYYDPGPGIAHDLKQTETTSRNNKNDNYVPFQDRASWVELLHYLSLQSGDKFQKELEIISLFETLKSISLEEKLWSHRIDLYKVRIKKRYKLYNYKKRHSHY